VCRLQLIVSLSDKSDEVCNCIIKAGLHADVLKNLRWESLPGATLKESRAKNFFVQMQVGLVHNVVWRTKAARGAFRQHQAVDVMQKFRDVTHDKVVFFLTSCNYPSSGRSSTRTEFLFSAKAKNI